MKPLVAIAALAGVGGLVLLAGNKSAGASTGGAITISGQGYFNGLNAGTQQAVISSMWRWYQQATSSGQPVWPAEVQNPNLTSASQLTDPNAFGMVIMAYQTVAYGWNTNSPSTGYTGISGVLDNLVSNSLLAGGVKVKSP